MISSPSETKVGDARRFKVGGFAKRSLTNVVGVEDQALSAEVQGIV